MPETPWIWTRERSIPSDTGAGRLVLDELLSKLAQYHWGEHEVFGVHLAMEEALVNAIKHGNGEDISKRVHVSCRLAPDRVRICITDEGDGFDPDALPDPTDPDRLECDTGRGVMLMRNFMNVVEFNAVGNSLVMEKSRVGENDDAA